MRRSDLNKVFVLAVVLSGMAAGLGMASRRHATMQTVVRDTLRRLDSEMKAKDLGPWFDRYQAYTAKLLDDSAGTNSYRDKTGNCRLQWFDRLMRAQLTAPLEAEGFSRALHETATGKEAVFAGLMRQGLAKIDVSTVNLPETKDRGTGLAFITNSLGIMHAGRERAFASLDGPARQVLLAQLQVQTLGGASRLGHRFSDIPGGRAACDALEILDHAGFAAAGMQAARLADQWREGGLDPWMQSLVGQTTTVTVHGVEGALAGVWPTPQGLVVVGGTGTNVYRLDDNLDIAAVVDLGGDDRYEEGTVGEGRPVLVLIDCGGDDRYAGQKTGIQAGAVGGISVLLDGGGNDRYEAVDLAQGSSLAGVGLLADAAGDDSYIGDRRIQGHATGGIGLLWDGGGQDQYRGAMLAQGVGGPLGFGLLDDLAGNDTYFAGGKYPGGYDDSPGFGGWSQGVGIGPRGSANGGIGVLLDGGGDDLYEYDYFCHGGGYWFSVGVARDFGGNDSRIGSTRTNWDGTPRVEKPFVRYGPAYGCHFAMGFLFDDAGNDLYSGTSAGVAFSWDISLSGLFDAEGNDRYTGGTGGTASQTSFAILADGAGDDVYGQGKPGWAFAISEYHAAVSNNSNFAMTYDMAGKDQWACGLSNGQQRVQGWAGGLLIDR